MSWFKSIFSRFGLVGTFISAISKYLIYVLLAISLALAATCYILVSEIKSHKLEISKLKGYKESASRDCAGRVNTLELSISDSQKETSKLLSEIEDGMESKLSGLYSRLNDYASAERDRRKNKNLEIIKSTLLEESLKDENHNSPSDYSSFLNVRSCELLKSISDHSRVGDGVGEITQGECRTKSQEQGKDEVNGSELPTTTSRPNTEYQD